MARIVSSERRLSLNTFLVELRETTLGWDYAAQNERVSVWIVAQSAGGEVALAYPAVGFGSDFPWGCVAVTADSCGMDSEWHSGLEDAAIHAGFLPTSWACRTRTAGLRSIRLLPNGRWSCQRMAIECLRLAPQTLI